MTALKFNVQLLILSVLVVMTSCIKDKELLTQREQFTLELPAITAITLDFPATVRIQQGAVQEIQINAQKEIFDALTKTVNGMEWTIDLQGGTYRYEPVTIDITLQQLEGLKTTSTGDIIVVSQFNDIDQLTVETTSTGTISFKGTATSIKVEMDGTGDIQLEGNTKSLEAINNGTGDLKAFTLKTNDASISTNSLGDVELQVQQSLLAIINSLGDIYYKGAPIIDSTISGNGELIDAN